MMLRATELAHDSSQEGKPAFAWEGVEDAPLVRIAPVQKDKSRPRALYGYVDVRRWRSRRHVDK
jgi:hypothetical protein